MAPASIPCGTQRNKTIKLFASEQVRALGACAHRHQLAARHDGPDPGRGSETQVVRGFTRREQWLVNVAQLSSRAISITSCVIVFVVVCGAPVCARRWRAASFGRSHGLFHCHRDPGEKGIAAATPRRVQRRGSRALRWRSLCEVLRRRLAQHRAEVGTRRPSRHGRQLSPPLSAARSAQRVRGLLREPSLPRSERPEQPEEAHVICQLAE